MPDLTNVHPKKRSTREKSDAGQCERLEKMFCDGNTNNAKSEGHQTQNLVNAVICVSVGKMSMTPVCQWR